MPCRTRPKTVCFPSNHGHGTVVTSEVLSSNKESWCIILNYRCFRPKADESILDHVTKSSCFVSLPTAQPKFTEILSIGATNKELRPVGVGPGMCTIEGPLLLRFNNDFSEGDFKSITLPVVQLIWRANTSKSHSCFFHRTHQCCICTWCENYVQSFLQFGRQYS